MRFNFLFREVVTGLRRNVTMTIAMVLTTAISLGLLGTGLLAVHTIDQTEQLYGDRLELVVSLTLDVSTRDQDCSQSICSGLRDELKSSPLVAGVTYENQQQAYARFQRLFQGQTLAALARPQGLPASLRVKLVDPTQSAQLSKVLTGKVGVARITDQRDVVERLFSFLRTIRDVVFTLALIEVVAAALLISNMVQLSAYNRRTEVGVMRLVGATRWYTQLPFLLEAATTGIVGTALAVASLMLGKGLFLDQAIRSGFGDGVIPVIQYGDILAVSPWLFLLGTGIAAITGYVTLRLYVRL
ncbi:permease-like cell division protein FtsX [Pseudonocardia spinosispora]|uniref:permease-like cell division protein FtsX n=1 Tax=Pseudonocardia spinosispora TaxID=103441 RepID=UPI0003F7759A|nr:permease-like cell division protein FtsX [Pseudonocardia spinosispora]